MIKQDILNKIKEENIQPKNRWSFLLREWLVWVFAGLSFILGSVGISILIFSTVNHVQIPSGFWSSVPILWVLVMFVFIGLAYLNIRNSKHGYKIRFWMISLVTLLATVVGGLVFYMVNAGAYVDNVLNENVSSYVGVEERLEGFWQNPQDGYLSGLITQVDFEDEVFEIEDSVGSRWKIDYSNISEDQKDIIRRVDHVRVVGYPAQRKNIEACDVLPWFVKGMSSDIDSFSKLLKDADLEGFGRDNIVQKVSNERIQEIIRSNRCEQ